MVAVPLILVIIFLSSDRTIMGEHTSGKLSKTLLWITFGAVLAAAGTTLWTII